MPLETSSFVPAKEWARKNLPENNELRLAMLSEPDIGPRIEINMKLDAYSKVLDSKVKLMRK
ncbi:MAG: hypothetical protein ABSF82_12070 [Candidatus Bathyarchaeia archaeon]|jgi:hypothetical protein